jgi:hypothetical protein
MKKTALKPVFLDLKHYWLGLLDSEAAVPSIRGIFSFSRAIVKNIPKSSFIYSINEREKKGEEKLGNG